MINKLKELLLGSLKRFLWKTSFPFFPPEFVYSRSGPVKGTYKINEHLTLYRVILTVHNKNCLFHCYSTSTRVAKVNLWDFYGYRYFKSMYQMGKAIVKTKIDRDMKRKEDYPHCEFICILPRGELSWNDVMELEKQL